MLEVGLIQRGKIFVNAALDLRIPKISESKYVAYSS